MSHPSIPCPCGQTAHPQPTSGNVVISPGGPLDHRACDAELTRLRGHLAVIAARLPAIRHALEFTEGHGEARIDCREALQALDEVWPF
jgi:hypothetical protein